MKEAIDNEKPSLVNAGQGFSILNTVSYRNRFLYSKYSPDKAIVSTVKNLQLQNDTLVVIFSPCLWYGLKELLEKFPDGCEILAVEFDEQLYSLAENQLTAFFENEPGFAEKFKSKITFTGARNSSSFSNSDNSGNSEKPVNSLEQFENDRINRGFFKRAVQLDFSAGTFFYAEQYRQLFSILVNSIAQFWKNRITLVKLGRLYSRNIFRNLYFTENNLQFDSLKATVLKPVIVFGAGESLNRTLSDIKKLGCTEQFYLLATDASLPVFEAEKIVPDAVIGVESQNIIQKAYLSSKDKNITLFTDLTSCPHVKNILSGKTVYFSTKYCNAEFLDELQKNHLTGNFMPALGSVGLYAVYAALLLRHNSSIPVFFTGLDFSFSTGATHAKETPAHKSRLISSNRFVAVENYASSFKEGAFSVKGKHERTFRTDITLNSYAQSFMQFFKGAVNLFDISYTGLDLQQPFLSLEYFYNKNKNALHEIQKDFSFGSLEELADIQKNNGQNERIRKFYEDEKNALICIKDLLSKGEQSEFRVKDKTLEVQLKELLEKRDYLYLHFPDGYRFSCEVNFLKRVRAEIDFFIKDIDLCLEKSN